MGIKTLMKIHRVNSRGMVAGASTRMGCTRGASVPSGDLAGLGQPADRLPDCAGDRSVSRRTCAMRTTGATSRLQPDQN